MDYEWYHIQNGRLAAILDFFCLQTLNFSLVLIINDQFTAARYLTLLILSHVQLQSTLRIGSGNERRCYIVTSSVIGWAYGQNGPCLSSNTHTYKIWWNI